MSLAWIIFLSIPFMLYFAFSLLLRSGLNRKYPITQNSNYSVSVIVAARDEAETIRDCLQSLAELDYPADLLEIIIVNDRSDDGTEQIITEFIKGKSQFKYLSISKSIATLSGKASAIAQAIEQSRGEIIFITDADCVAPKNWITKTSQYFADDVGMVAGFTLLDFFRGFFNSIQNLDWAYLLSAAAGAAGLGIPLTCMGNNFAFRRAAYEQVGGYQGVGFSVTEDFALLQKISQKTDWKILFAVDGECLIKTKPMRSIKDFFTQRKRWAIGGQTVHWLGKLLIGISLISSFILLGLILLSHNYSLILGLIFLTLLGDFLLLIALEKRLGSKFKLWLLPMYRFFFIVYATILMLDLLFDRKVTWKGVQYK